MPWEGCGKEGQVKRGCNQQVIEERSMAVNSLDGDYSIEIRGGLRFLIIFPQRLGTFYLSLPHAQAKERALSPPRARGE
jgi:hypothetical protein